MVDSPSTRSEWAALSWQDAQHEVARLINHYGFMIFEEKQLDQKQRSDVLVIRNDNDKVIFGIIEVKAYQNVTRSLQRKAMIQAVKYLNSVFIDAINNQRWGNKQKEFFVTVVYTNDYPAAFFQHHKADYENFLDKELVENYTLSLFSSTPNSFIRKLRQYTGYGHKQSKIDDYF